VKEDSETDSFGSTAPFWGVIPIGHLPWYYISDGEPADRRRDTRFLRVWPNGFAAIPKALFTSGLLKILGIRRDLDS
jgi:hypothetical protein